MYRYCLLYTSFSVFAQATTLDWSIIGDRKELDVLGAHLSPYCFPFVIENIANGNLKTEGVVSRLFSQMCIRDRVPNVGNFRQGRGFQ